MVFLAATPGVGVGGRVDLDYHSYAFQLGVGYHLLHLLRWVSSSDFAELAQFRECWDVKGEAVLVDDMPMQDVHFIEE